MSAGRGSPTNIGPSSDPKHGTGPGEHDTNNQHESIPPRRQPHPVSRVSKTLSDESRIGDIFGESHGGTRLPQVCRPTPAK